jgi:hypothetical protein
MPEAHVPATMMRQLDHLLGRELRFSWPHAPRRRSTPTASTGSNATGNYIPCGGCRTHASPIHTNVVVRLLAVVRKGVAVVAYEQALPIAVGDIVDARDPLASHVMAKA